MTLRSFHFFFIAISILLALFFGIFEMRVYLAEKAIADGVASVLGFVTAVGLFCYGIWFWIKSRRNAL